MVKSDDRDPERGAAMDRLPRDLVRVARFDDVRPLALENPLDLFQPQQHAVARSPRDERRADRVNARALAGFHAVRLAGDDQDVLIVARLLAEEALLLR